jgi:hypothetical protein
MKSSLTILLIFFCPCSFLIANAQDNGWEFGIKANTFNTNIPDPNQEGSDGGLAIQKYQFLLPQYRNQSFSLGAIIKKAMGFYSLNLRIDYYKDNITGEETEPQGVNEFSTITLTQKQNVFTLAPQIEFNNEFERTKLVYGFELPLRLYGNAPFTQTINSYSSNQLTETDLVTGEWGYGTSVGLGLFAGFYFKATSRISLGGILFSSIDYYFNQQTSYLTERDITQFNPLVEQDQHFENHLNYKSIVFEPVNISFIISYKINHF